MKHCVLLALLLVLGCTHGAPVDQDGMTAGSCTDEAMLGVAKEALTKINDDRTEGYIFSFHSLADVHTETHGDTGLVYYMTLRVVETNCSVISKKDWKLCEARPVSDTPVYGQCKAVLYINKPHRVERLYKYNCVIRPAPKVKVFEVCPDCPSLVANNDEMKQIASQSMEAFNKQSQLANKFAVEKVARSSLAFTEMGTGRSYNVEFTIQETTCTKDNDTAAENCDVMDCEFAHKGFCKSNKYRSPTGDEELSVQCQIYEPEAAQREKQLHNLGGEIDHSHSDTDHTHDHTADHTHDHAHDHTKSHSHPSDHTHEAGSEHHHTHDHKPGSSHRHAHAHSHDHSHTHDHVHAHHAKAHDHSGDTPNHHHNYNHADGTHTHEHDHELALDHDHKHAHLHDHEHHHHHHDHEHETTAHDHPEGEVIVIAAVGEATEGTAVPTAAPAVGVTLLAKQDPQIPGQLEPTVHPYPTTVSPDCPKPIPSSFVDQLFADDTTF